MSKLRFNPIIGEWVIFATERATRPNDFASRRARAMLPEYKTSCPFCPGNEQATQSQTLRLCDADGSWAVRAVENKFPTLSPVGPVMVSGSEYQLTISGVGRHEVVVETPAHHLNPALLPVDQIVKILNTYRNRMDEFYQDPRIKHVTIFKNHGEGAGSSQEHPHSQVIGTPVVPAQVERRLALALHHHASKGMCLYCHSLEQELADGSRIVAENDCFVALLPYAALSPFHVWVFPRVHRAYFGDISEPETRQLARMLKEVLLRVYVGLGNPDYNFVIRSLSPADRDAAHYHWYVSIVPRVSQTAGFEMGTGMFVNSALPEHSAKFLREVSLSSDSENAAVA